MKKLTFSIILVFICICNTFYSAEWHTQVSGTINTLNSVYFPVLNTGYIAGNNGTILKTNDGGASWISKISGTTSNLYSIYFLNPDIGFAAGDNTILKTVDGGITWSAQNTNFSVKSIYFVTPDIGFACGTNGSIMKTINGGEQWNVIVISPDLSFTSICFTDVNIGYVVGLESAYYKTTNGGVTWNSKNVYVSKNFYSMQFVNQSTGYIAGGWVLSTIMKTDNEGESWNNMLTGVTGVRLYASYFTDEYMGYVAGRNGVIMKTENGGLNWQNENSGTTEYLYSMNFVNPNVGYVVGANGKILSTISVIGITSISSIIPNKFSLYQNYPNPFNPATKIKFEIPGSPVAQTILSVYDMTGKEVSTVVNQQLQPGTYEINFDASNYPSGVYFYKLQSGNFIETKKMVLIK